MTDPAGQHRRFEALLQAHRKIVFKVAGLYGRSPEDRRDLQQEIGIQLWRAFAAYDDSRRFSTWMYRIALNVGISHLRRESLRDRHFEPLDPGFAETLAADAADTADEERLQQLYAVIGRLEALDRALILLVLDERSHAEIAEVLGITETNVATKIGRIKQRLRGEMTTSTASATGARNGTR